MMDSCMKGVDPALLAVNEVDVSGCGLDELITDKQRKKLIKFMKMLPILTKV